MASYRKKPVTVSAIRWEGGATDALDEFCGLHWTRADARGVPWPFDDAEEVVIYNTLERCWIPCAVGHWIIRGVKGELYPCEHETFIATYEPAD